MTGLARAEVHPILFVLRILLEDAMLRPWLPRYAEYAQPTRYRLLPGPR
jgi:protein-S-isoprenylcysteine O-methyltransferase Ste14